MLMAATVIKLHQDIYNGPSTTLLRHKDCFNITACTVNPRTDAIRTRYNRLQSAA
jgi:hypothetical protein